MTAATTAPPLPCAALAEVAGAWQRTLLVRADGSRDARTRVDWLQADSLYVDLRRPASGRSKRAPLGELDRHDLLAMSDQEGFAGQLREDAGGFEWQREVDLQPDNGRTDAGSLTWDGAVLTEHGRDEPYVEHWHRRPGLRRPCAGLRLSHTGDGRPAVLVRVGAHVGWACGRARPLPAGRTLRELVTEATDLAAARALFDCEVSVGRAEAPGISTVTRSSLPGRVRSTLEIRWLPGDRVRTSAVDVWDVLTLDGDPSPLVAAT